jgi:hypothetical protein
MPDESPSAGDPIPSNCQRIEVRVAELKQLFNAMDASPFRDRDLSPDAEEFIVGWGRELPRDAPLALIVYLDRRAGLPEEPALLREAIREFFAARAQNTRRRLRQLFRVGRVSLLIGVAFVAARLSDRLSAMPVRIVYKDDTRPDAWRSDWPVASPRDKTPPSDVPPAGR